jgi:hypothetical protein
LTRHVRVANSRLKVVLFSVSCKWLVRVAWKGVREWVVCRLEGSKVGMLKDKEAEELNGVRAGEEYVGEAAGPSDLRVNEESMGNGSTEFYYCQG